jgi:hypothetical protein
MSRPNFCKFVHLLVSQQHRLLSVRPSVSTFVVSLECRLPCCIVHVACARVWRHGRQALLPELAWPSVVVQRCCVRPTTVAFPAEMRLRRAAWPPRPGITIQVIAIMRFIVYGSRFGSPPLPPPLALVAPPSSPITRTTLSLATASTSHRRHPRLRTKHGYATQTEAEPKTNNPYTRLKTGRNHLGRGPRIAVRPEARVAT